MNFLRLNDYLISILFENEDILAFDKPYGVNAHTNDSKALHNDFILEGLIEILSKQLGYPLYVVHRLDQTTTGVIVFAKTPESAKKYADYFFQRQVKKTYLFITAATSTKTEFNIDKVIIHKGKELAAQTQLKFLNKSAGFELWQAKPLTGRNHQIRIHAQAAGISILGDATYDGDEYPFLCLHNHKIEFPNGICLVSEPPAYFRNLLFLNDRILAKTFFETDRRQRLFDLTRKQDQSLRLVHNKNDFADIGFTIDQYANNLVLSWYSEFWSETDRQRFATYAEYMQKPLLVRLMFNRGKDPVNKSQFIILPQTNQIPHPSAQQIPNPGAHRVGEESSGLQNTWITHENKMRFEIRTDSGQSLGIFLDQRLQRNWVLNHSKDRNVLNLFSYTCGFSLAAALGQARSVTSVDTNKNVLNWGRQNFAINQLDLKLGLESGADNKDANGSYHFYCRDSITYLDQMFAKNQNFDLIICDPPSFSRGDKGIFKIENHIENLLEKTLRLLNPGGDLLFSTNFENIFIPDIHQAILKTQKKLRLKKLDIFCIQSALDFELPGKRTILKSFLIHYVA